MSADAESEAVDVLEFGPPGGRPWPRDVVVVACKNVEGPIEIRDDQFESLCHYCGSKVVLGLPTLSRSRLPGLACGRSTAFMCSRCFSRHDFRQVEAWEDLRPKAPG